mgnify:CR=1 FL=1
MARKRYTDKFKAGAIAALTAAGYPENAYAVEQIAKKLDVPGRTLRRWFKGQHGQPPDDLVQDSKKALSELFEDEIRSVMESLDTARAAAPYRDRVMAAAILTDKLQLLTDKPTSRVDVGQTELVDINDDELDELLAAIAADRQGG